MNRARRELKQEHSFNSGKVLPKANLTLKIQAEIQDYGLRLRPRLKTTTEKLRARPAYNRLKTRSKSKSILRSAQLGPAWDGSIRPLKYQIGADKVGNLSQLSWVESSCYELSTVIELMIVDKIISPPKIAQNWVTSEPQIGA